MSPLPKATTDPARVLVADDDRDIRESLRDWLAQAGYEVDLAADGAEALDRVRAGRYDVLVTDLRMPRMDGLALLAALDEVPARPQVIFLSGQASKADAIAALREGRSFDFFEKPLHDMGALTRAIARALQHAPPPVAGPAWPPVGAWPAPVRAAFDVLAARHAEPLTLAEVAGAVGYNATYLSDLVTRETEHPLMQWLAAARLATARRLLLTTDLPISRVAADSGFADPSYFARQFRQAEGVTPLVWRKTRRTPPKKG